MDTLSPSYPVPTKRPTGLVVGIIGMFVMPVPGVLAFFFALLAIDAYGRGKEAQARNWADFARALGWLSIVTFGFFAAMIVLWFLTGS